MARRRGAAGLGETFQNTESAPRELPGGRGFPYLLGASPSLRLSPGPPRPTGEASRELGEPRPAELCGGHTWSKSIEEEGRPRGGEKGGIQTHRKLQAGLGSSKGGASSGKQPPIAPPRPLWMPPLRGRVDEVALRVTTNPTSSMSTKPYS